MERIKKIFKPKFSLVGWVLSIVPAIIMGLLLLRITEISLTSDRVAWASLILTSCILVAFVFFLLIYPTMRYEIENGYLTLRCGPFRSKISIKDCEIIGTHTLKYHPTSTGWKIPGYALFRVYYADAGYVRMYSTAMLRNILLIQTEKEIYGITPADEEGFIKEIERQKGAKIY
ncbi:MAG: PH domain-containing protein [Candidatus Edwardsbacteria bacterium]